jgi:translocation and assembly module TamB
VSETSTKKRWTRGRIALAVLGVFVLVVIGLAIYINSRSFHNLVRAKVVSALEDTTGGRVELHKLNWRLFQLEFDVEDLTIHGLEPAGEQPYAHIDHLKIRAKVISLFSREIGLNYVGASRPQVHIIVNPDGTTNQPVPKIKKRSGKSPIDQLFDLAIDRLEVSEGVLLLNDRKIPLDFTANKASAVVTFDKKVQIYSADLRIGEAVAKYGNGKPLPLNAELQLDLARNSAKIKALRLSTPESRIEASGSVTNLKDPKLELTYKVALNLPEVARAAAMNQITSGSLDIEGDGTGTASQFSSKGRLVLKNVTVHDPSLNVSNANAASAFTVDREKLSLSNVVAQLLGGTARGSVEVRNWLTTDEHAPREQRQTGRAQITLNSIDVDRIAAAVSSKNLPLERLNSTGSANGTITATWSGSPKNAVADLDLTVTPPAQAAPSQLPVTARLQGTFDLATQSLAVRTATLRTRGLELDTSGGLDPRGNELKIKFTATSLQELEPLLTAMGTKTRLPVELRGSATFNGSMRGTLKAPQLRGHLDVRDFDVVLAGAQPGQPPRRIHWDALSTDLDYSQQAASVSNGTLKRGAAVIAFAGQTTLHKGSFGDHSVFSANANLNNASLEDVQSLAGLSYPVTGTVNARVNVQGTKANLRGNGLLTVANGTLYGEPFKNLRAEVGLAGQQVQIPSFTVSQNGAHIQAAGSYDLHAKNFRLEAHGRDFDLAHIQKAQSPRLALEGHGNFDMTASGTVEQPIVQAKLTVTDIVANGEHIGDIHVDAVTRGRELGLTLRSQIEEASLSIDGKIQLVGDFPGTATVHFESLDFDPIMRGFLQNRVTGHSTMNGRIELSGPFKQPKLLAIHGSIPQLSAQVEKITLTNADPIEFSLVNQVATLQKLHLRGDGTDVEANGRVNLADEKLDAAAKGALNLKLLEGLGQQDLSSYGTVNMQLTVGGTIRKPVPVGQITIQDAGIAILDLPNGLANINGTLVFNENRLQVQSLTANTGGGTLDIGGFISYQSGIYFDLTAKGHEIRLRYPPGISASANADLRYSGNLKSSLLSGDVLITRFGVNQRFDFALYVARGKAPPTMPKANPLLDNLRLDVHVTSTPELRVETELAKVSGDADLRIRGTASKPVVLGRVNIAEGDVFFNSTKYHLERGDISFNNPVRIEPILNVEASARVREYDITIGFHGSVDHLTTTYRSEPPLPTADIIALLALGRTREDAVLNPPVQQNFTETASNAILGQALDAAVSSRVQKLFGVSRIKIDPQVGGPETATGARITIEQQVSNNVTLTYITNVARANQQVIQGEFNFTRDVSLVIVRDENGVLGFDVRIRQRKK